MKEHKTERDWARSFAEDTLRPLGLTQKGKGLTEVTEPVIEAVATALLAAKAEGLYEAVSIVDYHRELPMRNAAHKQTCLDIDVSLRATARRVSRGEYKNPVTSVM